MNAPASGAVAALIQAALMQVAALYVIDRFYTFMDRHCTVIFGNALRSIILFFTFLGTLFVPLSFFSRHLELNTKWSMGWEEGRSVNANLLTHASSEKLKSRW